VLLGESFSGPVAIALAAARPPGLLGLILCCSFARNPAPLLKPLQALIGALPVHAQLTRLIAPFLLGTASTPELRIALRSAIAQVAPSVMRARMRAVLAVDYSAQMREVNVPVLYLQAAQARVVLAGAAGYLRTLCPTMQLSRIDGPHLLLQVKPGEALPAIMAFIKTLEDGPGHCIF
jgi:pimeloyl-ACP methyl ester carboxylesterase